MSSAPLSWADWFLSQPRGRYFVRIDDSYLSCPFNYYGVRQRVNHFELAYDLLRKHFVRPSFASARPESEAWMIEQQTELLYGLLHARYLLTDAGRAGLLAKYRSGDFGRCPRVLCRQAVCLPYGITADLNEHPLKLFCPNCSDVYNIADRDLAKVDGAFFGPSWVPLFLQRYREIVPRGEPELYVGRIFGVRISEDFEDAHEDSSTT
jgi:casein kinase II subunit beta